MSPICAPLEIEPAAKPVTVPAILPVCISTLTSILVKEA